MRTLLGPVLLAAALYLPGASVRRILPVSDGSPDRTEHRLFEELLISAVLISWIGLLAAEFGIFRPLILVVALGAFCLAPALVRKTHVNKYGRTDAIGVAIALLAATWASPPFDTLLYGSDSSVYQAGGVHLALSGRLEFEDPTILALSPTERAWLLPSQAADGSPPYLRLAGGFTLADNNSPIVLPAFHHLFMVWTGLFVLAGGLSAAPWAAVLFTALGLWAIYRFVATANGLLAAVVAVLLLAATAPQYWYSRFPMPEVATQFLVWSGLASFVMWQQDRSIRDALIAAAALGIAGIMRADQLPLLALPVLWAPVFDTRPSRRHWAIFAAVLGVLWLHAALHLITFRTHYFSFFRNLAVAELPQQANLGGLLAVIAVLAAIGLVQWGQWRGWRPVLIAIAGAGTLADAELLLGGGEWNVSTVDNLTTYCGIPLLVAAAAGVAVVGRARTLALFWLTFALATAHVLIDPHAQPVPLWLARRFVPVVLPGIAFLAACTLSGLYRVGWRMTSAVASLVCFALPALRIIPLAMYTLYPQATLHVQTIASLLPPDAVVLAEKTTFQLTQLQAALWAIRGTPPYLIEPDRRPEVSELMRNLSPRPIYWLSVSMEPPGLMEGVATTPVASYEFAFPSAGFERYREQVVVRGTMRVDMYRLRLLDADARRAE